MNNKEILELLIERTGRKDSLCIEWAAKDVCVEETCPLGRPVVNQVVEYRCELPLRGDRRVIVDVSPASVRVCILVDQSGVSGTTLQDYEWQRLKIADPLSRDRRQSLIVAIVMDMESRMRSQMDEIAQWPPQEPASEPAFSATC